MCIGRGFSGDYCNDTHAGIIYKSPRRDRGRVSEVSKNGGAAISGIDKYMGIKALKSTLAITPKKSTELKASKDGTPALKSKKKVGAV
jgi:hypothetical protein